MLRLESLRKLRGPGHDGQDDSNHDEDLETSGPREG